MSLKTYLGRKLLRLGFDPRVILSLKHYPLYRKHRREWLRQGGRISHSYAILSDFNSPAGAASGHYFHQDLLVASYIFEKGPVRHIDVGSRVDGFVAHVASFRKVEVLDVRPLSESPHKNIVFRQANLMSGSEVEIADSISCLHAIEHFGLGRYADPIDVNGHIRGLENLIRMLKKNGTFYVSFPIGKADEVHFNAHRVFDPRSILEVPAVSASLQLQKLDYVDDDGNLHIDVDIDDVVGKVTYGCGIYTFKKM